MRRIARRHIPVGGDMDNRGREEREEMRNRRIALAGLSAIAMCLASCGNSKEAEEAVREGAWRSDAIAIVVANPSGNGGYYEYPSIELKETDPYRGTAWLHAYMVEGTAIHMDLESKEGSSRFLKSYYNFSWSIERRK